MKKMIPIILIALIFIVGLGVLSYPLVSSVVNNLNDRSKAYQTQAEVETMPQKEIDSYIDGAEKYNASLTGTIVLTDPFDKAAYEQIGAHYEETLDLGGGLMGYVDIPKINVYLPIYHGTSEEILSIGAGHLNNTSMPIGGIGSHCVITAHSAYPSRTFFDYLTDLEDGDAFYLHVLNMTLKYRVNQIKVVLPSDVSDLYINENKDYCTLVTCTPYSVNTHRLLVRGERVENDLVEEEDAFDTTIQSVKADDGAIFFLGYKLSYLTTALIIGGFLLVVTIIVVVVIRRLRKTKKAHKGEDS